MNYKEIDDLYVLAKADDENAKVLLLKRLDPLIKSSIKKYCPMWNFYDDLYNDGIVIILELIVSFNSSKGSFLNYVKNYLKYFYLDTFKYLVKDERNIGSLDDETVKIFEFLESDFNLEESILCSDEVLKLRSAFSVLTKRQRDVLIMFYFYNMSISDIANKLRIKYRTVVNTKTRAIEILREVLR